MLTHRVRCHLLLALLYLVLPRVAVAEPAIEVSSLRGLQGIAVQIEDLPEEFRKAGFRSERLRPDVVSRLIARRVPVIGVASSVPGSPLLFIDITLKRVEGGFAYTIQLLLYQDTSLLRSNSAQTPAVTWDASAVGIALAGASELRENLGHMCDVFAYDFGVANGTIRPSGGPRTK